MTGPPCSGLFAAPAPRRRSWAAVVTSALAHVVGVIGIALLARIAPAPAPPRGYQPVTFVMMAPLPIPHTPTPPLTLPVAPAV